MSEQAVPVAAEATPGLTQLQRLGNIFSAPSKTFQDIKRGNRSWWLPFLIVVLTGGLMYAAVTQQVTWKGVYDNQQRAMPEFFKNMMQNMPAEQRAEADRRGPRQQAITWALSPVGLLVIHMLYALFLWPTINFGFGGKASWLSIFAVTMYSMLVLWPIKLVLGAAALYAGATPDAFNLQNIAGTNIAYYLAKEETNAALYAFLTQLDPLIIWDLVLTSIGVAIVAGTKRSSGYIAVFGWWFFFLLIGVAFATIAG
jgi:hypothetical protein